jgi:hypothetical protein
MAIAVILKISTTEWHCMAESEQNNKTKGTKHFPVFNMNEDDSIFMWSRSFAIM